MKDYHYVDIKSEILLKGFAFDKFHHYLDERVSELMPIAHKHENDEPHPFIDGQYAEASFLYSMINGLRISIEGEEER